MKNIIAFVSFSLIVFALGCGIVPENPSSSDIANATSAKFAAGECPVMDQVLATRDEANYTSFLREALSAITLGTETLPVGSFKYKQQKYPGDIDIFEANKVELPKAQAKIYFAQRLSNIAERVAADPNIMLSDFKAGKDNRYKVDIGSFDKPGQLKGYNCDAIKDALKTLNDDELLTDEEYNTIFALVKEKPTQEEWMELKEAFRLHYTLRWSLDELLAQEKALRGGQILKLADALDGTTVKIDVFAPVTKTEGYTEVTTFYNLSYVENGQTHSLTEEMPDYKASITKDVFLFFDKNHRKSLKGAKRLWVLSTIVEDNLLTAKILPLLRSSAAALNQIIAESEVVRAISSADRLVRCAPVGHRLNRQIQEFEKRILENTSKIPLQKLSDKNSGLLRTIFDAFQEDCPRDSADGKNAVLSEDTKNLIVANLTQLEELLRPIIEDYAKDFLAGVGINPDDPLAALSGKTDVCPLTTLPLD